MRQAAAWGALHRGYQVAIMLYERQNSRSMYIKVCGWSLEAPLPRPRPEILPPAASASCPPARRLHLRCMLGAGAGSHVTILCVLQQVSRQQGPTQFHRRPSPGSAGGSSNSTPSGGPSSRYGRSRPGLAASTSSLCSCGDERECRAREGGREGGGGACWGMHRGGCAEPRREAGRRGPEPGFQPGVILRATCPPTCCCCTSSSSFWTRTLCTARMSTRLMGLSEGPGPRRPPSTSPSLELDQPGAAEGPGRSPAPAELPPAGAAPAGGAATAATSAAAASATPAGSAAASDAG